MDHIPLEALCGRIVRGHQELLESQNVPPRGYLGLQMGPQEQAELLHTSFIQSVGLDAGYIILWGLAHPGQPLG